MDDTEKSITLRSRSDPPNLGKLDVFLEERRYFIDKWFETEKNIFLSLFAVLGIPAALDLTGNWSSNKLTIALLSSLASIIILILSNRLEAISRHINWLNDVIGFIDEHLSYSDTVLRPHKRIKMRQRFIITNMKHMRLVYLILGFLLSWCPVLISMVMK